MCTPDIRDIVVHFDGQDLSKYGLFPMFCALESSIPLLIEALTSTRHKHIFAWYLTDVIHLPEYFAQVSVNRKRNP